MKTGRGWGIESKEWVSNWAEPTREGIENGPWAPQERGEKIIRVRILKESGYRELIKNQKKA